MAGVFAGCIALCVGFYVWGRGPSLILGAGGVVACSTRLGLGITFGWFSCLVGVVVFVAWGYFW